MNLWVSAATLLAATAVAVGRARGRSGVGAERRVPEAVNYEVG